MKKKTKMIKYIPWLDRDEARQPCWANWQPCPASLPSSLPATLSSTLLPTQSTALHSQHCETCQHRDNSDNNCISDLITCHITSVIDSRLGNPNLREFWQTRVYGFGGCQTTVPRVDLGVDLWVVWTTCRVPYIAISLAGDRMHMHN